MMRKKINFIILNPTDSSIKRGTVSKAFLRFLSLFFITCLLSLSYIIYDYYNIKKSFVSNRMLEKTISNHLYEIADQRKQINKFANEINTLKSNLVDLNTFEKKVRIIANIEISAEQGSLFGVGGSIPEDLDGNIDLKKKHNSLIREMHEQTKQIDVAVSNQAERFESLLKYLENQRNLLASTPAIKPSQGWVTSRFGYRISPFTGLREFHKGYDIANKKGTPIIATADGIISSVSFKGLLGRVLVIDHGHGMVTRYGHLSKALKKRGEPVKRGETIALVGNSGRTTGSHLHYEIYLNGIPVNPEKYILN